MRDRTTAIILAWIVWPAFDFYLGNPGKGIAKLLTLGGLGVWALVDALRVTLMSDEDFNATYNAAHQGAAPGATGDPVSEVSSAADNLRILGELHERGLLTDDEYDERRAREVERL
ncbi:MAG: TM2 domain-containing protein [Chloroflexi bacterium]|nr:TM2 domain-containing protein [Chloroflexota bacterium]